MSITSVPAYKRRLMEAAEIQFRSCGMLFDRMQKLLLVFRDPEFLKREKLDESTAGEWLSSRYLSDVAEDFTTLKTMVELFPERSTWEKRKFKELLRMALDSLAEQRKSKREGSTAKAPRRVSLKEFAQVESDRDDAIKVAENAQDVNAELRLENERLRGELAVANYRIRELEGMLNLDDAAA